MEIIHPSGETYDLTKDASLEIVRANPFFNDIGEQSVPVTIPLTDKNRRLLNNINRSDNNHRPERSFDVILRSGIFQQKAKQVIFGVNNSEIDTAFYLNTGEMYANLKSLDINKVFEQYNIESTFEDIRDIINDAFEGKSEIFSLFPVCCKDPNKADSLITLNKIDFDGYSSSGWHTLYNIIAQEETVIEGDITYTSVVPSGYYITPFVRIEWVLKKIFEHVGYTLNNNRFFTDADLKDLVILNNTVDTIVSGKILFKDIMPSGTVGDFLEIIRKRFNCEIIANMDYTVDIVFFNDMIERENMTDLSDTICNYPAITFAEPANIILSQKRTHNLSTTELTFNNIKEELKSIKVVDSLAESKLHRRVISVCERDTGDIYKCGIAGITLIYSNIGNIEDVKDDRNINIDLVKNKEVEIPGYIPDMETIDNIILPYVGNYRIVRSKIQKTVGDEIKIEDLSDSELDWMICYNLGEKISTNNYKYRIGGVDFNNGKSLRLFAQDGIYNRFYKLYNIHSLNAFDTYEYNHILSEREKLTLDPSSKFIINNQLFLLDNLNYDIGKDTTKTGLWKSLMIKEPAITVPAMIDDLPHAEYYWIINLECTWNGETTTSLPEYGTWRYLKIYNEGLFFDALFYAPETEYFDPPTEEHYGRGKTFYNKSFTILWSNNGELRVYDVKRSLVAVKML